MMADKRTYYKVPITVILQVSEMTKYVGTLANMCLQYLLFYLFIFFFTEAIAILFLLFNIVVQSTQSWDIMTIYKYIYIFYYNRTFIIIVIGDSFVIKYYD
jgi:hypothetical protein